MTTTKGPALLLQYGHSGSYKSTIAAELAAYGGVAMAPPTGMEPVSSYLDVPLIEFGAKDFVRGYQALPELMAKGYFVVFRPTSLLEAMQWMPYLRHAGIWCIVFDDVSLFAHDEVASMKQAAAAAAADRKDGKGPDNRRVYGDLGELGGVLRKMVWDLAMVVVINAHQRELDDGTVTADFPGKGMAKHLTHGASAVVRVAPHASMYGSKQIGFHWSSPRCQTKNRLTKGSPPDVAPPSLRALLVDSGRECPRHPSMLWMDDVMHKVAEKIAAGENYGDVQAIYRAWGSSANINPAHLTWAVREGYALGAYQANRLNGNCYWGDMGIAPGENTGGLPAIPPIPNAITNNAPAPANGTAAQTPQIPVPIQG